MKIHHIGAQNSVLKRFIAEMRDTNIQKDRMRFRRNVERVGEVLGYELSKTLESESEIVSTPLGEKEMTLPKDNIVICSVLRAGLPLHQGLLNYFDRADNAFISAYRRHQEESEAFDIVIEYLTSPSLNNKAVLIADPMLATGQSLLGAYNAIAHLGTPKEIHLVVAIGASQGIAYAARHFPENTHLWIAAIDDVLNTRGYIIPGLGDAGNLAFGTKLQ